MQDSALAAVERKGSALLQTLDQSSKDLGAKYELGFGEVVLEACCTSLSAPGEVDPAAMWLECVLTTKGYDHKAAMHTSSEAMWLGCVEREQPQMLWLV